MVYYEFVLILLVIIFREQGENLFVIFFYLSCRYVLSNTECEVEVKSYLSLFITFTWKYHRNLTKTPSAQ